MTLNFDVGIELAYELLTGGGVTTALPEPYRSALADWQALVAGPVPALRVVASRAGFDEWVTAGEPPALLKVHGSLSRDQAHLVDVVVLDIDELGQLTPSRRAAVDSLGSARRLLVTGYSGADPDIYQPLLAVAMAPESSWCCYSLPRDSPVPPDLRARRIALCTGAPEGLAVTALRKLLGLPGVPLWPEQQLAGAGYRERFDRWAREFRAGRSADKIAVAWAWLLADGGDLDTAERMLSELAGRESADAGTLMRHAEVLYTRARDDDRGRAELLYRRIAGDSRTDAGTRLMCRLRSADISRGRAIRGGRPSVLPLIRAFGQPMLVLIATRAGRREQEAAADAYRALQHTTLRVLEWAAGTAPRWSWPVLAYLCRAARRLGNPAQRLSGNGNRRALIRQHQLCSLPTQACSPAVRRNPGSSGRPSRCGTPTAAPTTRPVAAISQPPWQSLPPPEETWPAPAACSKWPATTTPRDAPTPGQSPPGRHCYVLSNGCPTDCTDSSGTRHGRIGNGWQVPGR